MRSLPPEPEVSLDPGARLERIERKLDEIASALAVALRALAVRAPTEERRRMPNEAAQQLVDEVRAKKTVFDGLLAARDALEAKLKEAQDASGMDDTNARIQEARDLLAAFVDPSTNTSPVVEGTAVEGTADAAPAEG